MASFERNEAKAPKSPDRTANSIISSFSSNKILCINHYNYVLFLLPFLEGNGLVSNEDALAIVRLRLPLGTNEGSELRQLLIIDSRE